MKVGEYLRTPYGLIGKITRIPPHDMYQDDGFYLDDEYIMCGKDVMKELKSSPNIIDLIEENDLLKIEYYSLRYNERVTRLFEVTFKDKEYINLSNAKCEFMLVNGEFNKGDKELKPIIKSIVTKEQFKDMEYKL